MQLAGQIAHVLEDVCPGLSTEGTAVALGLELCPTYGACYRYYRVTKRVEYDALAMPVDRDAYIQRAVVCYVLDTLGLRSPVSTTELAAEVFALLLGAKRTA